MFLFTRMAERARLPRCGRLERDARARGTVMSAGPSFLLRAALTACLLATFDSLPAAGFPAYSLFVDPDPYVVTKEFTLIYNTVPDTTLGPGGVRELFHLIYQRSAGPQRLETTFGHAWSADLTNWSVDTLAFSVDDAPWNAAHVWAPSIIYHDAKYYLFYTGVDQSSDQRIGYATTALLDTSNTVWDSPRVMVWEARSTKWAVPDPWMYSFQTQFRDPFVMDDPDHPGQLLMFYASLDSVDFRANSGGLVVGVARSQPGTLDAWEDLGSYRSTAEQISHIRQLEGPHAFPVPGTNAGWRLFYSSAGTPPGEAGQSTIRFETLAPGESVSDTTRGHWGAPQILMQYLGGDATVFGWSGSEQLHVPGADFLAGFTAWGPFVQGIAISRMRWNGDDFTLEIPSVTAVDEYRSPARAVRMRLADFSPRADRVTFLLDSPAELAGRLEVFDSMGRRLNSLLAGAVPRGSSSVVWDLSAGDGVRVPSGVYFARLSFTGGARSVRIPLLH